MKINEIVKDVQPKRVFWYREKYEFITPRESSDKWEYEVPVFFMGKIFGYVKYSGYKSSSYDGYRERENCVLHVFTNFVDNCAIIDTNKSGKVWQLKFRGCIDKKGYEELKAEIEKEVANLPLSDNERFKIGYYLERLRVDLDIKGSVLL
jgi:hypothetical protein